MTYKHSDPRVLPLPALPSPSLASPPPTIVVQPFLAHSTAQHQPQLGTYAPSSHPHGLASPQHEHAPHAQHTFARRSPAEEEKDAYFARSASVDSYGSHSYDKHWADVHAPGAAPLAVGGKPAPILLPPPRAAFVSEPGSPRSPMSLKQAMAFGDVGSVLDEKVGGRGAADMRKSGLDWARFSRMVKESEAEKESEWLRRKQGIAKKWWIVGWAGSVAVIVAIVIALVVHFKSASSDTPPTVSQLEGINSTTAEATLSGSVSLLAHSGGDFPSSGSSTSAAASATTSAATPTALDDVEDDMAVSTSSALQQDALDLETTTATRSLARTATAARSTTSSPSSTTSPRAASTQSVSVTATPSASSAPTSSSSSRSATTAAASAAPATATDADRRSKRWLRFGQDGKAERAERKAWNAVEFVHLPIGDARRKRSSVAGAH